MTGYYLAAPLIGLAKHTKDYGMLETLGSNWVARRSFTSHGKKDGG